MISTASVRRTSTGMFVSGPCLLHAVICLNASASMNCVINDSIDASGSDIVTVGASAGNMTGSVVFPDPIAMSKGIYGTIAGSGSPAVTVVYS